MAQIYSVFANKGDMIEPRLVSKIISKEGSIIYETKPKEIADFTTPPQAYMMTDILKDVIQRGTGKNAKVDGIELAGKTGTTNNNVDAWFCGYSPTIEAIVWVGRDNNKPIGKRATGGRVSAPLFAKYFEGLLKLYPDTKRVFDIPQGVYIGKYKGKTELYTDISPLPAIKKPKAKNIEEFEEENDDDKFYIEDEDDIQESDSINLDDESGDIPMAQPIDIDGVDEESYDNDDLHPKPKYETPVSYDSGTLF
jgi:penicillin-binding protein 1A